MVNKNILEDIVKTTLSVVSFMLIPAIFMYERNYETSFAFAKPLIFILIAMLFMLYGAIISISKSIKEGGDLTLTMIFYFIGIICFVISIVFLLWYVQGIPNYSFHDIIRLISIFIGIVVLLYSITTIATGSKKEG